MLTPIASMEMFYSRAIAPTRRIALGTMDLPGLEDGAYGAILIGAVLARFSHELTEDQLDDVDLFVDLVEARGDVPQPQLRHRLQKDRVGLQRCCHRLFAEGISLRFDFDTSTGTPAQHALAAVYAAGRQSENNGDRARAFEAARRGLDWVGAIDSRLVAYLNSGTSLGVTMSGDRYLWALSALGFEIDAERLERRQIQAAFRSRLLDAHPDQGGHFDDAADRIAELSEARRILLSR